MNGDGRGDRLVFNRDKATPDICGLREESLEEFDKLPDPDVLAQEIVEALEAPLDNSAKSPPTLLRRGMPSWDAAIVRCYSDSPGWLSSTLRPKFKVFPA